MSEQITRRDFRRIINSGTYSKVLLVDEFFGEKTCDKIFADTMTSSVYIESNNNKISILYVRNIGVEYKEDCIELSFLYDLAGYKSKIILQNNL